MVLDTNRAPNQVVRSQDVNVISQEVNTLGQQIAGKVSSSVLGQPSGVATLDAHGMVPGNQIGIPTGARGTLVQPTSTSPMPNRPVDPDGQTYYYTWVTFVDPFSTSPTKARLGDSWQDANKITPIPNPPGAITITNVTSTGFTATWGASTSNTVSTYNVYLNGTLKQNVSTTSYTFTGLTPSTPYNIAVGAVAPSGESNRVTASQTTSAQAGGGGGTPTSTTNVVIDSTLTVADITNLSTSDLQGLLKRIHGQGTKSFWNTKISERPAAQTTPWGVLSTNNGKTFAENLSHQMRYGDDRFEDHCKGAYPPKYQNAVNVDNFTIPVYIVPYGQPVKYVEWRNWDDYVIGRNVNADLQGQWLAVPLPTLTDCKPGNNAFRLSANAGQGATVIYGSDRVGGRFLLNGEDITVKALDGNYNSTYGGFAYTLVAPLTKAHASGEQATRQNQMESNGNDKSLVVMQPQPDGSIKMWEFWGIRMDPRSPNGVAASFGGYIGDTRNWDGFFPNDWGMRASSMSAFGGTITAADYLDTEIRHVLNYAPGVTGTVSGYDFLPPARRWDGYFVTSGVQAVDDGGDYGRHRIPLGTFFYLPASKYTDAYIDNWVNTHLAESADPTETKKVMRALRDYGAIATDTADNFVWYTESRQNLGTKYSGYTGITKPQYDWPVVLRDAWPDIVVCTPYTPPIPTNPIAIPLSGANADLPAGLPNTFNPSVFYQAYGNPLPWKLISNKVSITLNQTGAGGYEQNALAIKDGLVPWQVKNLRVKGTVTYPASSGSAFGVGVRSGWDPTDNSSGKWLGVVWGYGKVALRRMAAYSSNPPNFNTQVPAATGKVNEVPLAGSGQITKRFELYVNNLDMRFRMWDVGAADPTTDTTWDLWGAIPDPSVAFGGPGDAGAVTLLGLGNDSTQNTANGVTYTVDTMVVTPM